MTTWNKIAFILAGANLMCVLVHIIGGHYFAALFNLSCFGLLTIYNWNKDKNN